MGEPGRSGQAADRDADGGRCERDGQEHHQPGFHAAWPPGKMTRPTTARLSKPKNSRTANCREPSVAVRQMAKRQPQHGHAAAPPPDPEPEAAQRASRRPGRVPAHRLAPGAVPDGEHVRPAAGDAQRPDPRPEARPVPQGIQHEPGQHRREQDDEVPQPDLTGQEGQHDDGDDGPEEGDQRGVGVVEEPGDVGQPGREPHGYRPQPPREHDADVPGAPAVLLPHERVEVVGADPGREQDRQVDHGPAGPAHVQPGVHVLGVGDERRAALRLERGPPVHRGGPAADGRVQPLAGHLNRTVEHLLDRPRGPLDPRLRRAGPEVLRGLHDRDRGIVQVGQRLGQEVPARREVRV